VVAEPHKHKADSDNVTIKPPTSDGHGGDRKSEQVKIKSDNVTLDPDRGQVEGNEPTKYNLYWAQCFYCMDAQLNK
jgi:hypothetical protein